MKLATTAAALLFLPLVVLAGEGIRNNNYDKDQKNNRRLEFFDAIVDIEGSIIDSLVADIQDDEGIETGWFLASPNEDCDTVCYFKAGGRVGYCNEPIMNEVDTAAEMCWIAGELGLECEPAPENSQAINPSFSSTGGACFFNADGSGNSCFSEAEGVQRICCCGNCPIEECPQ